MSDRSVVVHPPSPTGGRRVTVDATILGVAYRLSDVVEFLRAAGLEDVDDLTVRTSGLITWKGGGPDVWPPAGLG